MKDKTIGKYSNGVFAEAKRSFTGNEIGIEIGHEIDAVWFGYLTIEQVRDFARWLNSIADNQESTETAK